MNPEALLEAIQGRDNLEVRARCRQEILKRVRKIGVSFDDELGCVDAKVKFANGVAREISIQGES